MANIDLLVGQLQGSVRGLRTDLDEVKETLKGQDEKLDKLLAQDNQTRGERRLAKWIVGGLMSSGFIGWVWEAFHR